MIVPGEASESDNEVELGDKEQQQEESSSRTGAAILGEGAEDAIDLDIDDEEEEEEEEDRTRSRLSLASVGAAISGAVVSAATARRAADNNKQVESTVNTVYNSVVCT